MEFDCEIGSKGSLWGHCNALGCTNGRRKIADWESQNCLVHTGSKHNHGVCVCAPPFILWTFPTEQRDSEARRKWVKLVNRKNWTPNAKSRLCSKHFQDGKPTHAHPYPTENLGYKTKAMPSARKAPAVRMTPPRVSKRQMQTPVSGTLQDNNCLNKDNIPLEHSYMKSIEACAGCDKLRKLTTRLEERIQKLEIENSTNRKNKTQIIRQFVGTDSNVNLNTGLKDRATLNALHHFLYPKVKKMRYWVGSRMHVVVSKARKFKQSPRKSGPQNKLSSFEEFILVLMKLRLGITNSFLCNIFQISEGLCSKILNTWIPLMARQLRALIFWPEKEAVLQHMPQDIGRKYPQLRCTIDCTEVFIQKPRHLQLQQLTWSDYKKHNTAKYLVGICPNGSISFLSAGYGGRSSDRGITVDSGFLDLVDAGDVILADRGFTIASDLLQRHAKLEIPPPSSGVEQQTKAAVAKTKKARIHVERAIGRLKWFAILRNTIPISLVPILDDIVVVCAALCNLRKPLVGK